MLKPKTPTFVCTCCDKALDARKFPKEVDGVPRMLCLNCIRFAAKFAEAAAAYSKILADTDKHNRAIAKRKAEAIARAAKQVPNLHGVASRWIGGYYPGGIN